MRLPDMALVLSATLLLATSTPAFADSLDESLASVARKDDPALELELADMSRTPPPAAPVSPAAVTTKPDSIAMPDRQVEPRGWTMLLIASIAAGVIAARRLRGPLP